MDTLRDRIPALAALAIPVLAGACWLIAAGAPRLYPLVNCTALALALCWIAFGRAPGTERGRHILAGALVALMLVPLASGPYLPSVTQDAVARWIPLGPVTLHAGAIAVPPLAVLAAQGGRTAAPVLFAGIAAAMFQPDAASGFALTFAAVGLHHAGQDWRVGMAAIAGFVASLLMAVSGELPPTPFVEGVLVDAARERLPAALALALALGAAFLLIALALPRPRPERLALAGALFGFGVIGLMSTYPSVLIGYGASPILGFGIALGLHRKIAA